MVSMNALRICQRPHTALPTANETGTKKVSRKAFQCVCARLQEVVELRDELEEVSESKETSVQGPLRPDDRLVVVICVHVVLATTQNDTLADGPLAGVGLGVEVFDRWLRDTVQEAEADRRDSDTT